MKVGIVTLLDEKNYGNRWQNYAMNVLLNAIDIKTENIYFWIRNTERQCWREVIKRKIPIKLAYLLHAISAYKITDIITLKKVIKFVYFTKKYIGSKIVMTNTFDELCYKFDSSKYDYFVVGSDQVWNPYYVASPIYFLQFVSKEKRWAFMASFGSDEIPQNKMGRYKKWISEMSYISVRESSGVDIVKKLTEKKADLFLDPTLLVEKEVWLSLSKKPKSVKLPSKYAVIFMFDYETDKLEKLCLKWDLELLLLNSKTYRELYSLDPAEMLYVLNHAQIIFTDSYHIMALSIKLNKQFYVFKRTGFEYMFSRLESTLERLALSQCICNDISKISLYPISKEMFKNINYKLNMEKEKFFKSVYNLINCKTVDIKKDKNGD